MGFSITIFLYACPSFILQLTSSTSQGYNDKTKTKQALLSSQVCAMSMYCKLEYSNNRISVNKQILALLVVVLRY